MKVVIMGCGRVGGRLAGLLAEDGHEVTILDLDEYSFRRLPSDFKGTALVGNGTDEDTLKKAGIEQADALGAESRSAVGAVVRSTFPRRPQPARKPL